MAHARQIAVGVVGVGLATGAERRARQAVAALDRVEQADLIVDVGARPAGMGRVAAAMLHLEEVADGVVHVALQIGTHGLTVAGVRQTRARAVVEAVRDRDTTGLTQVFPAAGFDQAVDGVVGVVAAGLDPPVTEKDRLLGVVPDVGDIAARIIGVGQILQAFTAALAAQVHQAQGQRIVAVVDDNPIAIGDALALAFGVVVDVGHEGHSFGYPAH